MGRAPCCEKVGLKTGPWSLEEDQILRSYVHNHGHGNWRALPKQAGLLRCGKSCRLRWINYLRPDVKRGNFSGEEEETILNLHQKLGNRWSAIAASLPGRTDNEIKNYWHTHLKKRIKQHQSNLYPTVLEESKPGKFQLELSTDFSSSSSSEGSSVAGGSVYSTPEIDLAVNGGSRSETPLELIDSGDYLKVFDNLVQSACNDDDDMDFWYNIFVRSGGTQEL